MLAPKVYTECPTPDIALRRLLLENVLLLAGRRVPADTNLDVHDAEVAVEVLKGKFHRAILNIYKHYADMAHRRHGQEIAAEKARRRESSRTAAAPGPTTGGAPSSGQPGSGSDAIHSTPYSNLSGAEMKEVLKKLTDTIGYVEFFKFSHDFKLKSTALLTAIQVGDVFLTCVPLEEENRDLRVMTFDTFCQSIILMALVAYRESPPAISPAAKVFSPS
ncbi:unnamed protein product [Symbiodinium microadriaticum]|nr:unnamed protein product [Symbiodinium microadriaticum]